MLGVLLRRRRWPVAYLGQAVPLPDLVKFARDIKPAVVVLVAMTEQAGRELLDLPRWMPEAVQMDGRRLPTAAASTTSCRSLSKA